MKPYSQEKTRIAELDVLRGLAALTVVVFHFTTSFEITYGDRHPVTNIRYGVFAVHLFFMISGFVIFMTLSNTRTALDFAVSRFSRLFPAFWAAVLLTQTVVRLYGTTDISVTWREAFINLTMLGEPLHARLVDNVYWSLLIELEFYIIMLSLFLADWLKHIERLVIPWLILQIFTVGAEAATHRPVPQALAVLFLLKYAHLFLAGILCYRIRFAGLSATRHILLLCCLITEFVVQGMAAGLVSIVFFALFYALARNRLGWIAVRPLVFLGTISYALYLIHCNIGYVIMLHLSGSPRAVQLLVAGIIVFFLASLVTFAIERPCQRAIRAWYKNLKQKRGGDLMLQKGAGIQEKTH